MYTVMYIVHKTVYNTQLSSVRSSLI